MRCKTVTRRTCMLGFAIAPLLLGLGLPAVSVAEENLQVLPLSERITLISGAGGNVVVFKGDQGLTLIDSGAREHADALLNTVAQVGNKAPVTTLFNTHWHEDHTGGNEAMHALGAQIISHENTKLWLGADFDVEWRNWTHAPRPETALPDLTFYDSGTLGLGGETVEYFHVPQAHTDGDIFLYFPDSNVMVAGGLMTDRKYPVTDIATGGWIGGLIKANEAMLEVANANTLIVPDHGPALTKADLLAQHAMLSSLYEVMKALAQEGQSGRDMLNNKITADFDAIWGDPEEFILETYRGMWAHTYDMGGFI